MPARISTRNFGFTSGSNDELTTNKIVPFSNVLTYIIPTGLTDVIKMHESDKNTTNETCVIGREIYSR